VFVLGLVIMLKINNKNCPVTTRGFLNNGVAFKNRWLLQGTLPNPDILPLKVCRCRRISRLETLWQPQKRAFYSRRMRCFSLPYVHELSFNIALRHFCAFTDALTQSRLFVYPLGLPAGPRRMSERDLPSRLGHDATPQQIHSSKSVPALHSK